MKLFAIIFIIVVFFSNLSLAAEGNKKEVSHYLIQARIKYDSSRYKEALELWSKVLALDPQNKEALKYINKTQKKTGLTFQNGRVTAEKMLTKPSIFQKRANKYIIQGKKYYSQGRYNWAISEWKKALLIDPSNTEIAEYIEKTAARLKQKPEERKPPEPSMLPKPPQPEYPEPVFERPKKGTLSLGDAVEIGLKNHLPIQIAKEQLDLAKFKEREAFRELFPQAMVRWDETSGIVSAKDYVGRKYQLKLQHPLYHGGELKNTWKQAKMNFEITKENYEKTKEDYCIELIRAYYDYTKTIRNFKIQEDLLKELEKDIEMAKKEHDAGLSALVDFLNVQTQYNQAHYSYLSSQNTLSLAKLSFLQLLNLDNDPESNITVDTEIIFKEYDIDLDECIKLAYENRSDLKINELGLKAAELGAKVAKSQQLPKIDLTTTVGKSAETFAPGALQMSDEWFVGAKVSVPWGPNTMNYSYTNEHIAPSLTVYGPTENEVHSVRFNILDNLAMYTEEKRSEVIREQAYSELLKGKQTAATQVREAYFNYQESLLKVKNSRANKELYEKELTIIKERRLMNEAQAQDVVSSKVKLAGEEINYNSALIENILAIAKLNKAIGIKDYFK
jgi:outer membrane protein TolC